MSPFGRIFGAAKENCVALKVFQRGALRLLEVELDLPHVPDKISEILAEIGTVVGCQNQELTPEPHRDCDKGVKGGCKDEDRKSMKEAREA